MNHISVLAEEVLQLLNPSKGELFIDATLGLGGHAQKLMEKGATIIGIDQDPNALEEAHSRLGDDVTYVRGNFGDISYLMRELEVEKVDGILMDIGVSSYQIDTPERGFSFQEDGPLDMRMNPEAPDTAATIVNRWREDQLADIFYKYGEERFGRKIANYICEYREKKPFRKTKELAEIVTRAYPPHKRFQHPHPATRVFQALRIAVNDELAVLEDGIAGSLKLLAPGGRLGIISFHSLEDRIVKHAFREAALSDEFSLITRKPIMATEEEIAENPRSRSAKLRGIMRVEG